MGKVGFNFPIFLTLIHYSIAWMLLAFFKALSLLPVSPPSKTTPFSSLFSLGAIMAFASGLANTSLKYNRSATWFQPAFWNTNSAISPVSSLFCSCTVLVSTKWLKLRSLLPLFLQNSFSSRKPFLSKRLVGNFLEGLPSILSCYLDFSASYYEIHHFAGFGSSSCLGRCSSSYYNRSRV